MTIFKKITAALLVLLLLLPSVLPVQAAENTDSLVKKLVSYFQYYQADAQLDYELILSEIEQQDPALAAAWRSILPFWIRLNADMPFYSNVLPDGLPEDDSLCIVVMGYYLKPNGSMRDELYDRLQVTLASALKYPNAYIMCTGGGTASDNKKLTEAGQMAKWLIKQGVDPSKVIVEDNALSTIENATYGCDLLYREYPQIRNIAVITSDYHIYRSCLYFHTQAALEAYREGYEPMQVVANATCRIKPTADRDLETQIEGVGMLTELDLEKLSRPKLSELDHITVSGATEYVLGSDLNLQVTAVYSSGYTRDVTSHANYYGYDFGISGFQTVTASYAEGKIRKNADFDVYVIPPATEATPTEAAPTEPVPEIPEVPVEPAGEPEKLLPALIFAAICIVLLAVLLVIKAKQKNKHRRRQKPTINLS